MSEFLNDIVAFCVASGIIALGALIFWWWVRALVWTYYRIKIYKDEYKENKTIRDKRIRELT